MRIAILTSSLHGIASAALPRLAAEKEIDIALVIASEGAIANRWRHYQRKVLKLLKIGPLGAMNGVRMRPWYGNAARFESLEAQAVKHGVRLERTPTVNCQTTKELFRSANVELGLSLGNSYIAPSVFSIPRHGMINVHHELLPEFQGAQSVIWQIHEGSRHTGYTIHQIDQHIDTGKILLRQQIAIDFKPTLEETVTHNVGRVYEASIEGIVAVLKDYERLAAESKPQPRGKSFTTPTYWEYRKMVRQHKKLYATKDL